MSAAPLHQRGSLACLVAIALAATACGGGSSSAAAKSSGSAPTTTAGTSAAVTITTAGGATGAAGATSGSTPTSTAPTSNAPAAATTTKVKATGGGNFCKDVATALNNSAAASAPTTPAKAKAQVEQGLAEFSILAHEAPSTIKADVAVLANAITVLYQAVAKAGYDFTKVDQADLTAMSSAKVTAASDKVDAYVKDTCGIDTGADASG